MKEFAAAIYSAVQAGRLKEPFNAAMVKSACPGWAEKTYHTFLGKHAEGNGNTTELFVCVSRGRYRLRAGHLAAGNTIRTETTGGKAYVDFRLQGADYLRARRRSYGTWYRQHCGEEAKTAHNKLECHLCSDWDGCRSDCTLSTVSCTPCGKSLTF